MKRPNILLIMTDQQRADSLGYARRSGTDTPHLDALAARGVIFDTAYSAAPVCVPARSSLLTGTFDNRLPRAEDGLALQEGVWTVAHGLGRVGYETALFGKMHFFPIQARHGFEVVRSCEHLTVSAGYPPGAWDDYSVALAREGLADIRGDHVGTGTFPYPEEFHPTAWITRQATGFLERRRSERPFFMIVSYTSPHTPHDPPARYAAMYDPEQETLPENTFAANLELPPAFREAFQRKPGEFFGPALASKHSPEALRQTQASIRALIRQIDDNVAELLQRISLDDTLVFFTSDHGDYGGRRGLLGKVPWIPFEDLARVSFFCSGFGIDGGRRVSAPVQSPDFATTCVALSGATPPEFFADTQNLMPILRGAPAPEDRAVFCALGLGWPTIRKGRYKYISHWQGDRVLFDLEADPDETTNVADQHPKLAEELHLHLHMQVGRPAFTARADALDY